MGENRFKLLFVFVAYISLLVNIYNVYGWQSNSTGWKANFVDVLDSMGDIYYEALGLNPKLKDTYTAEDISKARYERTRELQKLAISSKEKFDSGEIDEDKYDGGIENARQFALVNEAAECLGNDKCRKAVNLGKDPAKWDPIMETKVFKMLVSELKDIIPDNNMDIYDDDDDENMDENARRIKQGTSQVENFLKPKFDFEGKKVSGISLIFSKMIEIARETEEPMPLHEYFLVFLELAYNKMEAQNASGQNSQQSAFAANSAYLLPIATQFLRESSANICEYIDTTFAVASENKNVPEFVVLLLKGIKGNLTKDNCPYISPIDIQKQLDDSPSYNNFVNEVTNFLPTIAAQNGEMNFVATSQKLFTFFNRVFQGGENNQNGVQTPDMDPSNIFQAIAAFSSGGAAGGGGQIPFASLLSALPFMQSSNPFSKPQQNTNLRGAA